MATTEPPARSGATIRARVQGERTDEFINHVREMDEELVSWVDGFVFGRVWNRPGLSFEERMLIAIAMLAAGGQTLNVLRAYLDGALQDGIPAAKVHEVLVMTSIYAGFPKMMQVLDLWTEVKKAHVLRQGRNAPST
jgi:4-carboxymuconolactone decarboxylase